MLVGRSPHVAGQDVPGASEVGRGGVCRAQCILGKGSGTGPEPAFSRKPTCRGGPGGWARPSRLRVPLQGAADGSVVRPCLFCWLRPSWVGQRLQAGCWKGRTWPADTRQMCQHPPAQAHSHRQPRAMTSPPSRIAQSCSPGHAGCPPSVTLASRRSRGEHAPEAPPPQLPRSSASPCVTGQSWAPGRWAPADAGGRPHAACLAPQLLTRDTRMSQHRVALPRSHEVVPTKCCENQPALRLCVQGCLQVGFRAASLRSPSQAGTPTTMGVQAGEARGCEQEPRAHARGPPGELALLGGSA